MTEKVECIIITCDNCGEIYESIAGYTIFPDIDSSDVRDNGWYVEEDHKRHYCEGCFTINDDDEMISTNLIDAKNTNL